MRRKFTAAVALATAVVLGIVGVAVAQKPAPPPPVTIQILNVSDWHGYLDPTGSPSNGGAWNISARWQADRQAYPTLTLTAGDDFGASPALASFFDEAPAVKAERMMGIQVNTFGNHNFDRGVAHLQTMIDLAGAPTSDAAPGNPYTYVAANLKNLDGNLTGVDPIRYFNVGGAKIAVIGIVNEEAPGLVLPGSFGSIEITDGVAAANKFARIARQAKSDAVIVITHKGVRGVTAGQPFGELVDFAQAVDSSLVDVVIGDHTDVQYAGVVDNVLITENRSFGQTYAKTLLNVQPGRPGEAGSVLSKQVSFVNPAAASLPGLGTTCPPAPAFCDQALVDMLVPYREALREKLDAWVGTTTQAFDRGGNIERRQEVPQGDLIADAMRWKYGTQLALMNSGGIRSQLPACSYTPADHTLRRANWNSAHTAVSSCTGYPTAGPPYDLVLGDIYTTLPFGNVVTVRTVTGAQLWAAMENGVSKIAPDGSGGDGRFPQVAGFKFTFHYLNPAGSRVTAMTLDDGTPIPNSASATYTLALPNFTNAGGDSYAMFADGQGVTKDLDAAVLVDYVKAIGPNIDAASIPGNRITKLP